MKFDSVIIGGGLAGLVCGIRLSKAGRRCAIISSGQSALHFSSGSFDLLGALPDGTPVTAPAESVAETIRQAPEHPYARIGAERFGALAAEAAALLAEAGVAVEGDAARNHYRLTPMGGLKPAWLTLAGYVRSEASDALPWRKVVLFNAEGFLDFYTQFLAEGFRRMGTECAVRTFNMPALETIRNNPSEMRSANIARIFDRQENLDELARILRREAGDAEAVLLSPEYGQDTPVLGAETDKKQGGQGDGGHAAPVGAGIAGAVAAAALLPTVGRRLHAGRHRRALRGRRRPHHGALHGRPRRHRLRGRQLRARHGQLFQSGIGGRDGRRARTAVRPTAAHGTTATCSRRSRSNSSA